MFPGNFGGLKKLCFYVCVCFHIFFAVSPLSWKATLGYRYLGTMSLMELRNFCFSNFCSSG